jgi:cardiolipin synthase
VPGTDSAKCEDQISGRRKENRYLEVYESDYPFNNPRYINFERRAVYYFPDFIEPNYLTILRVFICFALFFFASKISYAGILILASIGGLTDFFDGALARSNPTRPEGKKTRFGVIMDPVADKLLIFSILYILIIRGDLPLLFFLFMTLGEAHLVLIPFLSYSFHIYKLIINRGYDAPRNVKHRIETVSFGRVKLHLYIYSILLILLGRLIDAKMFVFAGNILLGMGISAAFIALYLYIQRYCKNPY